MATALMTKEQNNIQCVLCPNCSKLYPLTDEKGQRNELPSKCKRCGAPMDFDAAQVFAEEMARKEHQPGLTVLGDAMRARGGAPVHQESEPAQGRRGR